MTKSFHPAQSYGLVHGSLDDISRNEPSSALAALCAHNMVGLLRGVNNDSQVIRNEIRLVSLVYPPCIYTPFSQRTLTLTSHPHLLGLLAGLAFFSLFFSLSSLALRISTTPLTSLWLPSPSLYLPTLFSLASATLFLRTW